MTKLSYNSPITLTAFTVAVVGPMVALVYYYATHPPVSQPLVPTETISKSQHIGGVPTTAKNSQTNDGVAASNAHSNKSTTPATVSTRRPETITDAAPKQAEIAKTVTKEYAYHALATPNDPMYSTFTDASGATHTPFALQHMGAPAVWNTTTGSQVVVAVIDTGFALNHEDLKTQWYQNPNETGNTQSGDRCWTGVPQDKSTNRCDDDNNGYVDDWRGWNFYGRYTPTATPCAQNGLGTYVANNNPMAGASGDDILYAEDKTCFNIDDGDPFAAVSHGTSTAGITGAASNNGIGIATLNWNVKVMPLQALGDDGSGWTSKIISAMRYAVDNGASIISMSLGGDSDDPALADAVNYAYAHNVIVVAAAGNCGTGSESGCSPSSPGAMGYPALYNHAISVGATDKNDSRASFSSYGPGLDVMAPGYGELIAPLVSRPTDPTTGKPSADGTTFNYSNSYSAGLAGTSFSTPYVANTISIIKSVKPSYSVDDVTALVDGTAQKVSGMNGAVYTNQYGHGVINANTIATVAKSLATSNGTPSLAQTGNYKSEHTFGPSDTMSSGCTVAANTYCTIWMHNTVNGYDRYLPYAALSSGKPGWQWSGSILTSDEWSVRAVQGANSSGAYLLFSK